jgi:hypothetical protein
METYLPVLIVTITGMFFTSISLIVRYAYKSKCARISCCCITIERNIPEEVKEDLHNPDPQRVSLDMR